MKRSQGAEVDTGGREEEGVGHEQAGGRQGMGRDRNYQSVKPRSTLSNKLRP